MLVQNLGPGAIDRLGFPVEQLRRDYPSLVITSISGYGRGGPFELRKAFDLLLQGETGSSPRQEMVMSWRKLASVWATSGRRFTGRSVRWPRCMSGALPVRGVSSNITVRCPVGVDGVSRLLHPLRRRAAGPGGGSPRHRGALRVLSLRRRCGTAGSERQLAAPLADGSVPHVSDRLPCPKSWFDPRGTARRNLTDGRSHGRVGRCNDGVAGDRGRDAPESSCRSPAMSCQVALKFLDETRR